MDLLDPALKDHQVLDLEDLLAKVLRVVSVDLLDPALKYHQVLDLLVLPDLALKDPMVEILAVPAVNLVLAHRDPLDLDLKVLLARASVAPVVLLAQDPKYLVLPDNQLHKDLKDPSVPLDQDLRDPVAQALVDPSLKDPMAPDLRVL